MAAQTDVYDAIVIGAGIQGCFTAYHLAKHRKKVILLEQFFLPHSRGSSHGQSRIIRRAYSKDFYTQMMEECYQMWAQLEHEDAIRQLGGLVHDGEKVMEIKPGLPVMVKSTSRSYQAKSLIITAGPWTNRLLHPLGIELPLQTLRINVCYWQEKVPGSYSVSQAFPCLLGLGLSLTPYHIYGLPSGEYPGLMKVCYHHGNNADPEERDCLAAFSDIQDVQILSRFVHDHLTDLEPEPAIMEHCMYTNTPDEHFILDQHPKYDNIVIGAGFSGHGFKLAPVVGKILYELSMKLTPSYDLTHFRISRFPGLGKAHL
ncbi:peroxisomal sarcosine oxidase isoform X6 [Manis javanica]|uniref:peroxisomal sarcosine oxidase isoform X6 n=1 Tax=Manis javanica TaxID=9974 RepID=UPI00187A542A|nr:peroxisomal sarcosine oxidase isoform X7 [Manis javanica]